MSKSTNMKFMNSHLPWVKYFTVITMKSDKWSECSCISHSKLLVKTARFTVHLVTIFSVRRAERQGHRHFLGLMFDNCLSEGKVDYIVMYLTNTQAWRTALHNCYLQISAQIDVTILPYFWNLKPSKIFVGRKFVRKMSCLCK